MDRIKEIIEKVLNNGDKALLEYTELFDSIKLDISDIKLDQKVFSEAHLKLDDKIKESIDLAKNNIENYAKTSNFYKESTYETDELKVTDRYIPVEKIGIYVPGGEYSYPSTVLMCAIPAKIAGVKEIYMVTPPGNITPEVLYAADISGVTDIFQIGGAQAVAALAYGTDTVPKVDLIVGPGNSYVQKAKHILSDVVGIDMIAGPSEVVIISDGKHPVEWILTDLYAQSEHVDDTKAVLITLNNDEADKITELISEEYKKRIEVKIAKTIEEAISLSNSFAPEHLQLMLDEKTIDDKIISQIKNAGAVFVGTYTPVAIGDYWAGPSHTLPTGRSAKYSEGLDVKKFLKKVSFITYKKEAMKKNSEYIALFAESEGMKNHARSIRIRNSNDE